MPARKSQELREKEGDGQEMREFPERPIANRHSNIFDLNDALQKES
jgi:hypothetical protein